MENLNTRNAEAIAKAEPAGTLGPTGREIAPALHPKVLAIFIGSYAAMLLAIWLIFGTELNAMIVLGVATVYFGMYFGIPIAMARLAERTNARPESGKFRRFLAGDVDIETGPVSGWGAIWQMMTIPVGLVFAFIAIAIIIRLGA